MLSISLCLYAYIEIPSFNISFGARVSSSGVMEHLIVPTTTVSAGNKQYQPKRRTHNTKITVFYDLAFCVITVPSAASAWTMNCTYNTASVLSYYPSLLSMKIRGVLCTASS